MLVSSGNLLSRLILARSPTLNRRVGPGVFWLNVHRSVKTYDFSFLYIELADCAALKVKSGRVLAEDLMGIAAAPNIRPKPLVN